jgi:hypothetical protein
MQVEERHKQGLVMMVVFLCIFMANEQGLDLIAALDTKNFMSSY